MRRSSGNPTDQKFATYFWRSQGPCRYGRNDLGLVHRVCTAALAMTDVSNAVVGSYPSGSGERVWVALPHMPLAEAVDVEAWAVLADGAVSPIAAAQLDGPPRALVEFAWATELDALVGIWVDQRR